MLQICIHRSAITRGAHPERFGIHTGTVCVAFIASSGNISLLWREVRVEEKHERTSESGVCFVVFFFCFYFSA